MPDLPSSTVTFIFTDIEGSTRLWERDRAVMAAAMERHLSRLDAAIQAHGSVARLEPHRGSSNHVAQFRHAPYSVVTPLIRRIEIKV